MIRDCKKSGNFFNLAYEKLKEHREVWKNSPVLRQVYQNYYERIVSSLPQSCSKIIEVGGGIGNLKEYIPDVIASEIVFCEWVDIVLDAHNLPFVDSSLDALVIIDVLHHLESPVTFFREAQRVLRDKGRLIMIDMYISPISFVVLKTLHPEPVDLKENFFEKEMNLGSEKDPWDSNQAMVTKLFWHQKDIFNSNFPSLKIIQRETFDWCWPLSGGFSFPAFWLSSMKHWLKPMSQWHFLNKFSAFRSFVVLEKSDIKNSAHFENSQK